MTFGEQRTGVALTLNSESAGTEMVRHLPQNALFLALMGRSPDPTTLRRYRCVNQISTGSSSSSPRFGARPSF